MIFLKYRHPLPENFRPQFERRFCSKTLYGCWLSFVDWCNPPSSSLRLVYPPQNFWNYCYRIRSQMDPSRNALLILVAVWETLRRFILYGHLPPISGIIQIRLRRYAGQFWRSKDEHISNVFLWNPSHAPASVDDQLELINNSSVVTQDVG